MCVQWSGCCRAALWCSCLMEWTALDRNTPQVALSDSCRSPFFVTLSCRFLSELSCRFLSHCTVVFCQNCPVVFCHTVLSFFVTVLSFFVRTVLSFFVTLSCRFLSHCPVVFCHTVLSFFVTLSCRFLSHCPVVFCHTVLSFFVTLSCRFLSELSCRFLSELSCRFLSELSCTGICLSQEIMSHNRTFKWKVSSPSNKFLFFFPLLLFLPVSLLMLHSTLKWQEWPALWPMVINGRRRSGNQCVHPDLTCYSLCFFKPQSPLQCQWTFAVFSARDQTGSLWLWGRHVMFPQSDHFDVHFAYLRKNQYVRLCSRPTSKSKHCYCYLKRSLMLCERGFSWQNIIRISRSS